MGRYSNDFDSFWIHFWTTLKADPKTFLGANEDPIKQFILEQRSKTFTP